MLQVADVGGGTGFCTQGVVKTVKATNVTLVDQSPHQLEKARTKPDLQGVTVLEVSICPAMPPWALVACTLLEKDEEA